MPRTARLSQLSPADPDKRVKILDAATCVFAERGFFGAQVADIAKRAGIAAGTVYLYFRSKDDVLLSVFDRTMQDAIREGRTALEGIDHPADRLRRIARIDSRSRGFRVVCIAMRSEFVRTTITAAQERA